MQPVIILIFILIVAILYLVVTRYKQEERERLEKSKQLIQDMIDKIPKKMKKIMKKSKDTFPAGMIKLASKVAETQPGTARKEDKMIEAFEDIKDIRYGKIGASNYDKCNTANKWIKISSFTISGEWDPRGFTLEVYPKIRNAGSSRQTLVCLVRNNTTDVEDPYISLNTHNEGEPNSRLIKDVRVVRTSGSGILGNTIEVWIQFMESCANSSYVMYYLYNFTTNDFIATTPQEMVDNPPSGQAWGISERVEPQNGKTTLTGAKGSGWGTAINVNAPVVPESLYSLHFGDGSAIHERQSGMGYIKDQPNRIWGNTRGTLGMHVHQDDDLHLYSSGWNPLFSVKGGSGDAYIKGNINVNKLKSNSDVCINNTCITENDLINLKKLEKTTFVYTIDRDLGPGTNNIVNVPKGGFVTSFLFEGDTQDQGWGNENCNNIQFIINGQIISFFHAKRGRQATKYINPEFRVKFNKDDMLSVSMDGYPGCTGIIFAGSKITMTIEG